MLLLAALSALAAAPPEPRATVRAQATVRIERPVAVGAVQWDSIPQGQRREVLTRDETGRPLLLRLVENP